MRSLFTVFLSLLTTGAFADAPVAATPQATYSPLFMLVIFIVIFYFLLIRPQMKRNKEQRQLLGALSRGDEVVTSSGLYGRVDKVDETTVDVALTDTVIVKMQKQAIVGLLPKGTLK